ncbi:MAG: HEAT repeat domain-containing protein [Gemmatimonadaceae bacterium]
MNVIVHHYRVHYTVTLVALTVASLVCAPILLSACDRQERIGGRSVTDRSRALYSSDSATRFHAAAVLASTAPTSDQAVELILSALEDDRLAALYDTLARAISRLGSRAAPAVPRLGIQSRDRHPEVRRNAIIALGQIGGAVPATVPVLAKALSDPDHEVRIAAVAALRSALGPQTCPSTPTYTVFGSRGSIRTREI